MPTSPSRLFKSSYSDRSRRRRDRRAETLGMKTMLQERRAFQVLYPDDGKRRLPMTRGECVDGPRPCPLVSCKWHLYLDVQRRTGSIKFNFPDLDPHQLVYSCALDLADRGGLVLEDVAAVMNMTRERVRQIELIAQERLEGALREAELAPDELMTPIDEPDGDTAAPSRPPLDPEAVADEFHELELL